MWVVADLPRAGDQTQVLVLALLLVALRIQAVVQAVVLLVHLFLDGLGLRVAPRVGQVQRPAVHVRRAVVGVVVGAAVLLQARLHDHRHRVGGHGRHRHVQRARLDDVVEAAVRVLGQIEVVLQSVDVVPHGLVHVGGRGLLQGRRVVTSRDDGRHGGGRRRRGKLSDGSREPLFQNWGQDGHRPGQLLVCFRTSSPSRLPDVGLVFRTFMMD